MASSSSHGDTGEIKEISKYFGSRAYYSGELWKDQLYDHENAFTMISTSTGIRLWSMAIDVRSCSAPEDPTEMLPLRGLRDGDRVLFHYTSKQAAEINETCQFAHCLKKSEMVMVIATPSCFLSFFPAHAKFHAEHAPEGFDAITSLNSNGVRASKLIDNSVFGCGVYCTSRAPHRWKSKAEVILNNYFPVKKAWEKRTQGIEGIEWPRPEELHSDQEVLQEDHVHRLLKTKFGEDLLQRRKGLTDYCVALVCDRDGAKVLRMVYCQL